MRRITKLVLTLSLLINGACHTNATPLSQLSVSNGSTTLGGTTTAGTTTSGTTTLGTTTSGTTTGTTTAGTTTSGTTTGSGTATVGPKDVVAIYRPATGVWYFLGSNITRQFGNDTMVPVPQMWSQAGYATIAVVQRSSTNWFFYNNLIPAYANANPFNFGWPAHDYPAPGNYNNGAEIEFGSFRSEQDPLQQDGKAHWYIVGAPSVISFGAFGDLPAQGYWDNDAYTDIAVYRPGERTWYVKPSTGASPYSTSIPGLQVAAGVPCQAAQAHYDGLVEMNLAVACTTGGVLQWSVYHPLTGQIEVFNFGNAGDIVASGLWDPNHL